MCSPDYVPDIGSDKQGRKEDRSSESQMKGGEGGKRVKAIGWSLLHGKIKCYETEYTPPMGLETGWKGEEKLEDAGIGPALWRIQ